MEIKNYKKLVEVMKALNVAKIDVLEANVSEYSGLKIELVFSKSIPVKK